MKRFTFKIRTALLVILVLSLLLGIGVQLRRFADLEAFGREAAYYEGMEELSTQYAKKLIDQVNLIKSCEKEDNNCDYLVNQLLEMLRYSSMINEGYDSSSLRTASPSPKRTKMVVKIALEAADWAKRDAQEHADHKRIYQRLRTYR